MKMRKVLFLTSLVGMLTACIVCYNGYKQQQNSAPLEIAAPYEYEVAFTSHYDVSEVEVTYFDKKIGREFTRTVFVRNSDIDNLKSFKSIKFFEEKKLTIEKAIELAHSRGFETFDEHFCEVSRITMNNIKNLYVFGYFENGYKRVPTIQLKKTNKA